MYDLCLKSTKVLHRRYSGYRQSVDFQLRYTEIVIVSTEVLHFGGGGVAGAELHLLLYTKDKLRMLQIRLSFVLLHKNEYIC